MNHTVNNIKVLKVLLQTASPMAIHTGKREVGFDNQLVRDVNGLPLIPATAFAGVWRHLAEDAFANLSSAKPSATRIDSWFGKTDGDESQASRLMISNGVMLDSQHQVVKPYTAKDKLEKDALLRVCLHERPLHRERVAINDRGVALEGAKFDQILLPTGVRFALTVQWPATGVSVDEQTLLLSLLNDKRFALGASTRNGLGQLNVVYSELVDIDLSKGAEAGKKLQAAISKPCHQQNELAKSCYQHNSHQLLASLPLKALDNWRCGSGTQLLGKQPESGSVGIISYSEHTITWQNNRAAMTERQPVLCGSSVKGMLAHRIAYHYRKHSQKWAHTMENDTHQDWQKRPAELGDLLGFIDGDTKTAQAGRLIVLDSAISYDPEQMVIRTHNSIDRFTGGVRDGALYSEELLYQPTFELQLYLTPGEPLSDALSGALLDTLNDIKFGLLPIGAGAGRGTSMVMPDSSKTWQINATLLRNQSNLEGQA
jgi:CRISPR/Cas system CSM-associated protein Csm3 (group 7 of RAMP superfamily)